MCSRPWDIPVTGVIVADLVESNSSSVAAPIVSRNVEILRVKPGPLDTASTHTNAQRQVEISPSTDTTLHPCSGPYCAAVDIFDGGGWTGTSQRNLVTNYGQCVNLAHWASGSVRSWISLARRRAFYIPQITASEFSFCRSMRIALEST